MKISYISIALVIALASSSCNLGKKISAKKRNNNRTNIEATVATPAATTQGNDNTLAQAIVTNASEQLYGEWTILTAHNKKIHADERAFINLDFKDNRFYGNNGCNVINGEFTITGDEIRFVNIISTMMSCPNTASERNVMKTLNETYSFKLYNKNGLEFLHLTNSRGGIIMTLKRQNLDFLNGAWTVKELDGKPITDNNVKLVIDTEQLSIHGDSGCNIVNGKVFIDTNKDWSIQFQQLTSTRKMCENMRTETSLLIALEVTETCRKISNDEIALLDNGGNTVVVLTRLALDTKQ